MNKKCPAWSLDNAIFVWNAKNNPGLAFFLAHLKSRQDWKIVCFCFIYVQLLWAVVASKEWSKRNWGKCLKVSSQITRYFCFQFVYKVGPQSTLISTMFNVNISFLSESGVKLFDRSHRHVFLNRKKKFKLWRWYRATMRKRNSVNVQNYPTGSLDNGCFHLEYQEGP